jgi:DnaJ family protein A protein 2
MFGGIPFEHFANGGGARGSGFGRQSSNSDPPDTTKLYETLEIPKDASQKDIKKAYFRLSKLHHPDKGGDEHKFKEIAAAYEILSDPEKRKKYDQYGLEGVDTDEGTAARGEDLFSMFFGGGRRSARSSGPRKGPSVNHPIKVSLEDLYNGKTVKLAVNRKVIVGQVKTCDKCNGQGVVVEIRQLGPGMITQMQRPCSECHGQGNNAHTKTERKVLEVHVEKGAHHNEKITFPGAADEVPGMEPGDVNFVIQEKPHELFKRKGADLLVTKEISLNQALTGFHWKIKHLDQREIVIKTRPGQIIECETTDQETGRTLPYITMVKGEGMPSKGNPFVKGNLYVAFHVQFPKTLPADVIVKIRDLLPDADMPEDYDIEHVEEHFMDEADLRHFGKGGAEMRSNEYDSDDEEGGGAHGVQCQQS